MLCSRESCDNPLPAEMVVCLCKELWFCSRACYKITYQTHKRDCKHKASRLSTTFHPPSKLVLSSHSKSSQPMAQSSHHHVSQSSQHHEAQSSQHHVARSKGQNPHTVGLSSNPVNHPHTVGLSSEPVGMSVSQESVTVIGHVVNQSLQNDTETQSLITTDQADTLPGPSSTPGSQSSIPGSQSSIPASQGREQGTGRFAGKLGLNVKGTQGRSDGQKKADKVASNVTKWIGRAVMNMEKIQKVRPDAEQLFIFKSNQLRGNKKSVMYKSKGKAPDPVAVTVPAEQGSLGENTAQLEPFQGVPVETLMAEAANSRVRLSELHCHVCHEKLGSNHSNRIVCTRRLCYRAPLHLTCSNFDFPPTMLSKMRCYYMCPEHRHRHRGDQENSDESEDIEEEIEDVPTQTPSTSTGPSKGRKKNENIFKPVRLSSQMMEVFKTAAKYQEPNEVRAMLAIYKKNLQAVNKMLVPDAAISYLIGSKEPFKSLQLYSLLRAAKHIQPS